MATCALVGKVDFNREHFLTQTFEGIFAVDAGYEHLEKIAVTPDRIIGDFDSLGYKPDQPGVSVYPVRKDESDIEIALHQAQKDGYDTLIVYGCLGGRLDFTYAVMQLLIHFAEEGLRIFAVGIEYAVTALSGRHHSVLSFDPGAQGTVSVFAAGNYAQGVDERGLSYSLEGATLTNDKPLGVSNSFGESGALISVKEGTLLVFFSLEAWPKMQ